MKLCLIIFLTFLNTIWACDYISIGANKEKCANTQVEKKGNTCCYVKIKKNGYTMDFCAEMVNKDGPIKEYKNKLKSANQLSSIEVQCQSRILKYNVMTMIVGMFIYIVLL